MMLVQNQLVCGICTQEYKQDNLPRLMPKCGHTFCETCILKLLDQSEGSDCVKVYCPEDKIEMKFDEKDINNFPKNISLIKLMSTKDTKKQNQSFKDNSFNQSNIIKTPLDVDQQDKLLIKQINQSTKGTVQNFLNDNNKSIRNEYFNAIKRQQMCQLHDKPLEIVCIQDLVKICANCAIFGNHKGHSFKSVDEIGKDKDVKFRNLVEILDKNHTFYDKLYKKQPLIEATRLISQKKDSLIRETREKFSKLIKLVEFSEKKSIEKIIKTTQQLEDKIKQQMKIPQNISDIYKSWERGVLIHMDSLEIQDNLEELLMFLNYDKSPDQRDIIEDGQEIHKQLERFQQSIVTSRDDTINSISVQFNAEAQKKLNEYFNVIIKQKKLLPLINSNHSKKKSNDNLEFEKKQQVDQLLIDDFKIEQLPKIELPKTQTKLEPLNTSVISNEQKISSKTCKSPTGSELKQNKQFKEASNRDVSGNSDKPIEKQTSLNSNIIIKKKMKIKLPEKYQKILDGIINDQLEVADFTNAELGDATVLQIVECLKGKKVKTLKLIRNKLTDEGLQKMWIYFQNIITLNLSQNLLTDTFIDRIILNLNKMPHLKTIILSQNKIKQRNVKNRIEEIKKHEVVVSL